MTTDNKLFCKNIRIFDEIFENDYVSKNNNNWNWYNKYTYIL